MGKPARVIVVPSQRENYTQQLARVVSSERDYFDSQIAILVQRMDDKDEATKVLQESVTRVPTDLQTAIANVSELMDSSLKHQSELMTEKFGSVQTQFKERDDRSRSEALANDTKLTTALTAQKESAAEQNKSSALAINKTEDATKEAIDKLQTLFQTTVGALADKIDDVKALAQSNASAILGVIQKQLGGTESIREKRENHNAVYAAVGIGATVLGIGLALLGFFLSRANP